MQKHWDIMRSDDAGDSWREVSGNLPTDFGFPIDIHAHEPETIYVVPIKSDSEHFPLDGKLRVYRSRTGGNEWEELTKGLPQKDCYVNVLRDAMTVDSLDSCGIYFGTTGGQVYGSTDAGDTWNAIVRDLAGGSVGRGADAAMIRVVLPHHLRTLARVGDEVQIELNGSVTLRSRSRCARGKISDAARHDPRSRHAEAPAIREIFRLRRGCVARSAGHAVARRDRNRCGAFLYHGRDCRWLDQNNVRRVL